MKIQVISMNYKIASDALRSKFAFSKEQQLRILKQLKKEGIKEAVILNTCNRTEAYCAGMEDGKAFQIMERILLEEAGVQNQSGVKECMLRFCKEGAIHHLFMVAAGLYSLVLGEDQILGQVKQAYFFSKELGYCSTTFNQLFRLAITAAKKVKTQTMLSKTSVSTASLALKQAKEALGELENKKLMIIGATGDIGSILLKDAFSIKKLQIFVTMRSNPSHELHSKKQDFTIVDYEKRYQYMEQMDVIISATKSPHYTVTKEQLSKHISCEKKRVLIDLAIPQDIEEAVKELPFVTYFSMEAMEGLAKENNKKKESYVPEAKELLREYEEEFIKGYLYRENKESLDRVKQNILKSQQEDNLEQQMERLLFLIKKESSKEEFSHFIDIINKLDR